jgi:hypothetical protein
VNCIWTKRMLSSLAASIFSIALFSPSSITIDLTSLGRSH